MKRKLCTGRVLLALVPFLAISPAAQAVVTLYNRVFVGSNGNDANNCSNAATPCLGFAGAMAQVQPGGEVIALTTGGFGPIPTITQSVTISGATGVVAFTGWPVIVNAPGATVVIRGITIDGGGQTTGSGIAVSSVGNLHVESCVITGWAGFGPSVGSGIYFTSGGQLFVKDTIIRGNGMNGIWVSPPAAGTAQASISNCRLEQNGYGLIVDNSNGFASQVTIKDSIAAGNKYIALLAQATGELNAEGCLVTNNSTGLETLGIGSSLRASNCTVTDNTLGLFTNGGVLASRGNNTVQGNATKGSFTGPYTAD